MNYYRDRKAGRITKWQSLDDIVKKMRGFSQTLDIWYLAESMPKEEKGLIERHPKNFEVKLTKKGRLWRTDEGRITVTYSSNEVLSVEVSKPIIEHRNDCQNLAWCSRCSPTNFVAKFVPSTK